METITVPGEWSDWTQHKITGTEYVYYIRARAYYKPGGEIEFIEYATTTHLSSEDQIKFDEQQAKREEERKNRVVTIKWIPQCDS